MRNFFFFFLPFLYFSPRPTTKKSNLATTEEPIKAFFFCFFFILFLFLFFDESQRKVSAFSFQAVVREIWAPPPPTPPEVPKCESGTQFGLLIKSPREKKKPSRAEQQRRDPSRPPALPEHFNGAENYLPASGSFFFSKVCSCKKKKKRKKV